MPELKLQSSVFSDQETIPEKYTGDGENISPPLSWSNVPEGTKEFALIVDDPDAPRPNPWVHWVVYNIPGSEVSIPEGGLPSGAKEGQNTFGNTNYGGPAPPKGHGKHRYFFKLYALDTSLDLAPGASKDVLLQAMEGHILADAQLVGLYER